MLSDSEDVSESELYGSTHMDSGDDFLPESENSNLKTRRLSSSSSDDVGDTIEDVQSPEAAADVPQSGRKKLVRKALWKRNIQKTKRTKGLPYVNTAGVHKPGKQLGNSCLCTLKCFDVIGQENCNKIFHDFYAIPNKDLQDSYLHGLMKRDVVERHRPRSGAGTTKNASFVYKVSFYT